jgi:hypothetical protein
MPAAASRILPQIDDPAPLLRELVSSGRRFADLNR